MLISQITINKTREIESMDLNINDKLIMYLSNRGEPNSDRTGGGSPYYFDSRKKFMRNSMNIAINEHDIFFMKTVCN